MSTQPTSAREAMDMVRAGLGYLAAADATAMGAETQAQCLQALEQASSVGTAARTSILAAFTSGQGYSGDADYSPRAWLIHKTHVTRGAAVGYTAWVRRAAAHPEVAAALAAGTVPESVARTICGWTDKLPEDCQEDADAILLGAALGGADVADLAGLAGEIYARSLPRDKIKDKDADEGEDQEEDEAFADRCVRVETTFGGAGVLTGDLSPECASIVATVLDALSAPAGAEDARSQPQRCHDALQEAMRRLVTAGLLPERAGQPVKAVVHISLADLMRLEGSSALLQEWTSRVRAQWAGHRARASAGGGGGGAWLDGDAAEAVACDAAMVPFVTGEVDPGALEDLVRLCVQLDRLRHHPRGHADAPARTAAAAPAAAAAAAGSTARAAPRRVAQHRPRPGRDRPGYRPGLGGPRARDHRQGRGPALGPGRAGVVPAAPAARRPARRAEPAAGHRVLPVHPGRDPQRRHPQRQALPVGRGLPPARQRLRSPPREAQEERRKDQHQRLRPAVLLPPSDRHPQMGLDPGPEPRRHHHRLEPRKTKVLHSHSPPVSPG